MAPPDIAPDTSRATNGPGLVRAGVLGSLSPTSSPSASAVNTQAVTGRPKNDRRVPSRRSRPRWAAQATKASGVIVRRPATAPIKNAERGRAIPVRLGPARGRRGRTELVFVIRVAPHEGGLDAAGARVAVQLSPVVHELVAQHVEGHPAGPHRLPRRRHHRRELRVPDPLDRRVRAIEALPREGDERRLAAQPGGRGGLARLVGGDLSLRDAFRNVAHHRTRDVDAQLRGRAHSRDRTGGVAIVGNGVEQAEIHAIFLAELVPHLVERGLVHERLQRGGALNMRRGAARSKTLTASGLFCYSTTYRPPPVVAITRHITTNINS